MHAFFLISSNFYAPKPFLSMSQVIDHDFRDPLDGSLPRFNHLGLPHIFPDYGLNRSVSSWFGIVHQHPSYLPRIYYYGLTVSVFLGLTSQWSGITQFQMPTILCRFILLLFTDAAAKLSILYLCKSCQILVPTRLYNFTCKMTRLDNLSGAGIV